VASLAFFPLAAVRGDEADAQRLFGDLDANHDGKLAADEVNSDQRLLVKRLVRTGDDDGDGRLTAAEFAAALEPKRADKNLVEKVGSHVPGADALVVFLAKMDANHDHQLESKEIPSDYKPLFEQMLRADGNDDGKLDQRELAQGAPRLGVLAQVAATRRGMDIEAELKKLPSEDRASLDRMDAYGRPGEMMADPKRAEEMFKRLDANGDQQLTMEEAPSIFGDRFAEMFQRGDANGDKKLSKKEFLVLSQRAAQFQAAKVEPETVRRLKKQLLNRFDRDGDGKLTAREAPPRLAQNFDRADLDSNGYLDDSELTQAAEVMARLERVGMAPAGARPAFAPAKRQALKKAEKAAAKSADKSAKGSDKPGDDDGNKKSKPAKKSKSDKVAKKS
jgi:Ca2+-binding EF-hand superfamily protein